MERFEFSGNYTHNIDPKGRATIPAVFREALSEGFTLGLNNEFNAVALYPREKWYEMRQKLDRIPDSDARAMGYVRTINMYSFPGQTLDNQGRILIPTALRQKAKLEKAIRFVGMGRYLEVWAEGVFMEQYNSTIENIADLMAYVNERYFADGN